MEILTAFEISAGTITDKNTGEVIPYNNRILYCVSDDVGSDFHGFVPFQEKVKTSDIAAWLNIPGAITSTGNINVTVVDKFLDSILQKEIRFRRGPNRKGEFVITGLSVVEKTT